MQPGVLMIGCGGREHALAWRLAQDRVAPALYCAPGNAGTARLGVNLPLAAEDADGLLAWALEHRPHLTVVGPEGPLCAGIVDRFAAHGLRIFGPSRAAARLEGSKAFAKEIMQAAGVPTAHAEIFRDADAALAHLRGRGLPVVVKADGLAAGKGVTVCATRAEAEAAVRAALADGVFGAAGATVLIEDALAGEEVSLLALADGERFVLLASAQDHKRVGDGDRGPNTGGMGAYSPAPMATDAVLRVAREQVFAPTLAELRRRGVAYHGVLYAGLMLTADGPRVLEFNCRFGDPETQAILPRLASDLLPALDACVDGSLDECRLAWRADACACVVLAAEGYPGACRKGDEITGLEAAEQEEGVVVFHAGTRLEGGRVVTAGGRVLGVAARGPSGAAAAAACYRAAARIAFRGAHYRRDIAARAISFIAQPGTTA